MANRDRFSHAKLQSIILQATPTKPHKKTLNLSILLPAVRLKEADIRSSVGTMWSNLPLLQFWNQLLALAFCQEVSDVRNGYDLHLTPRILVFCSNVWQKGDVVHCDKLGWNFRFFLENVKTCGCELFHNCVTD